ncbi:MAG TPA: nuclear transport factor 2 family protein [Thermomicrobiales bacterium]
MDQEGNHMEDHLQTLGQEWATAELHGDADTLGHMLADDFVGIGPRGFMLTKEQWLARYTSGGLRQDSFTWDEVRVRVYGDAAVATGRQTQQGAFQGHDIAGQFRVTQVFVQQGGRWLLAALHLSAIAGEGRG